MPLANTATLSGTQARGLELLPSECALALRLHGRSLRGASW